MVENADRPRPADTDSAYTSRPNVVTLICILTFISVGWQITAFMFVHFAFFATGIPLLSKVEFLVTIVILGVFTVIPLTIGIGMWLAMNWARILFVTVIPLMRVVGLVLQPDLFNVFALAIVLVFVVLLFRPPASDYFRGTPLPAIEPASGLSTAPREIVRCPSCGKEIYSTVTTCHHCGADTRGGASA